MDPLAKQGNPLQERVGLSCHHDASRDDRESVQDDVPQGIARLGQKRRQLDMLRVGDGRARGRCRA